MNTIADFHYDQYYHVYNRSNNKEYLFKNHDNRIYFLKQYKRYLGSFAYFHAYALMGNHFHFSIKIKSKREIDSYLIQLPKKEQTVAIRNYLSELEIIKDKSTTSESISTPSISKLIISQHRRFFISYSQAINKMYKRQGNLFSRKFKRSLFIPEVKFKFLQYYIHHNARKHGFVKDFRDYAYTSYHSILEKDGWLIDLNEIKLRFGSLSSFENFHRETHYEDKFKDLTIEET